MYKVKIQFHEDPDFSLEKGAYNLVRARVKNLANACPDETKFMLDAIGFNQSHFEEALIPFVGWIGHRGDDFAVYHGLPNLDYVDEATIEAYGQLIYPQQIVSFGMKTSEQMGRIIFPGYVDYEWRK